MKPITGFILGILIGALISGFNFGLPFMKLEEKYDNVLSHANLLEIELKECESVEIERQKQEGRSGTLGLKVKDTIYSADGSLIAFTKDQVIERLQFQLELSVISHAKALIRLRECELIKLEDK